MLLEPRSIFGAQNEAQRYIYICSIFLYICSIFLFSTDIAKLAVKHNGTLIELATNTVTMDTLESIIMQIKQMSADGEDPLPRHRTRKYHGLSMRDMSVDKQTLFNRFFRRTLSTKSCDNLLAL